MAKKSKKKLEIEREAARNKKRKEFESEAESYMQIAERYASADEPSSFDPTEFVRRKLEEWEREQTQEPKGKYQDRQRTTSEYKKYFATYIQKYCPEVFDELREMVPLFRRVFGEDKDGFHRIFDIRKNEYLRSIRSALDVVINEPFLNTPIYFGMFGQHVEKYRMDFQVGDTREVLVILQLLFNSDESGEEQSNSEAIEYVRDRLSFIPGNEPLYGSVEDSKVPKILSAMAEEGIKHLRKNERAAYYANEARQRLLEGLKNPDYPYEPDIDAFIELQLALFDWAKRHYLEKDWLLRYAYFVTSRLSENEEIRIEDIILPIEASKSLTPLPFEFKFAGWEPGDERREDYEKRLGDGFSEEVGIYFHNMSNYLNLHRLKKVSKPRDFERVKWLVFRILKSSNAESIVERFFPDESARRTESPRAAKTFENKKKHVENEMRELSVYDLPYRNLVSR